MSEYKYKEEIMDDVSFEPAFQYPHEANSHNAKVEEIKEVYVKARLWNMNRKRMDDWQRKAQAFDAILKSYEEAISGSHMADDVFDIIDKYKSGDSE